MTQEGEKNQSGRRLTRLVIFFAAVAIAILAIRPVLTGIQSASSPLPKSRFTALIEEKALSVLGQKTNLDRFSAEIQVEPIAEPVSNINSQTQNLLEAVKNLPRDQAEAIRAQLCKEICGDCLDANISESEANVSE